MKLCVFSLTTILQNRMMNAFDIRWGVVRFDVLEFISF